MPSGRRRSCPTSSGLRDEAGLPIVYVSHQIEEVARLADRIVLLSEGSVAATGSVDEIFSRPDLMPLTGRFQAGAVLDARVAEQNLSGKMSRLAIPGASLWVPSVPLPVDSPMRIRIRARDVSIALEKPERISIRNVLPGTVHAVAESDGPFRTVTIAVADETGESRIAATVTGSAVRDLGLAPGLPVFALIKSRGHGPAQHGATAAGRNRHLIRIGQSSRDDAAFAVWRRNAHLGAVTAGGIAMPTNNKLIDDFARVTTGMLGVAAGVRSEAEAMVKARLQDLLADMDLVTREEFEVARAMAAKARDEQEALSVRLTELAARLESSKNGPRPKQGRLTDRHFRLRRQPAEFAESSGYNDDAGEQRHMVNRESISGVIPFFHE